MLYIFRLLIPAIILMTCCTSASERWFLEPLGAYEIKNDNPHLGGLSALHIKDFGKTFLMLTDKGKYFETKIVRNNESKITGLYIKKNGFLLNSSGQRLSRRNIDSESMATKDGKGFFISFESNNRVMFHETLTSKGKFLPKHDDFAKFDFNKGLEAIATNSDGELFAIPEKPPEGNIEFPIYKLLDNAWNVVGHFKPKNNFLVSDAFFLPNNDLLLLERAYDWKLGFKTQLRVLQMDGNTIKNEYTILQLDSGKHNHEGISIWQNNRGSDFLTLISDNNFIPFITSEIREFKLFKKKN